MDDQLDQSARTDRILDVALHGRHDLAQALDDLAEEGDDSPELRRWLRTELEAARDAFADGDSRGSVGRLAVAAEAFLWWDLPQMAGALCGLAVNYDSELMVSGHVVDPVDRANLRNVTGLLAFMLGRFDTAHDQFVDARGLAADAGDPQMQASALLNLCNVARIRNDKPAARELADIALALYEAAGDTRGRFKLLLTMTDMAMEDGDYDAAAVWLETLGGIAKLGESDLTSSYHHARGRFLASQRLWDDAERAMQTSLRAARRARHSDHELATMQSLAALAAEAGKPALARRRTRAAVKVARARNLPNRLALLLPSYISGELNAGNLAAARTAADELLELASSSRTDVANARFLLGAVRLEQGETAAALQDFIAARAELAALGQVAEFSGELSASIFHNTVIAYGRLGTVLDHADELARAARDLTDSAGALEHLGLALARQMQWEESARLLLESFALEPPSERAWSGLVAAAQLEGNESAGVRTALLQSAVGVAEEHGQKTVAMRARNDLALARIDDDDLEEGLALLRENLHAAAAAGDSVMRQQALFNLAETRRRLEDVDGAERDAVMALDLAETLQDEALIAASCVQVGQVLSEREHMEEARSYFRRALESSSTDDPAYASALSGLAGVALAEGSSDVAVELYTECLRLDTRSPVQRLENLIYLSEALAAQGSRRSYVRRLQQIVGNARGTPFNLHMATGMGRIARRWSEAGKPKYAGEVLAVALLIWAVETNRLEVHLASDDRSPLVTALLASAWELHREEQAGERADLTKNALQDELRKQFKSARATKQMIGLLNTALEAIVDDPD